MRSLFPGMDPYLERPGIWETFHGTLATMIMGALNRQIRPKYIAQIEQQVYIHERSAVERRTALPDVSVLKRRGVRGQVVAIDPSVQPPTIVRMPAVELRRQRVVKVFDRLGGNLITAIEVLSPTNKNPREGFEQYVLKREEYRGRLVNLVEIDLLRRGKRMPAGERVPPGSYYVFVCRASRRDRAEVWPIGLRERLPVVAVPLGPDDKDATLDLQALRDRVFEEAGWGAEIYGWKPVPPLRGGDADWSKQILTHAKIIAVPQE